MPVNTPALPNSFIILVRIGHAADDHRRDTRDRARPRSAVGDADGGGGTGDFIRQADRLVEADAGACNQATGFDI